MFAHITEQKPPLCKGRCHACCDGGIVQTHGLSRTPVPTRALQSLTPTIPQSSTPTAPFTQRGLGCVQLQHNKETQIFFHHNAQFYFANLWARNRRDRRPRRSAITRKFHQMHTKAIQKKLPPPCKAGFHRFAISSTIVDISSTIVDISSTIVDISSTGVDFIRRRRI